MPIGSLRYDKPSPAIIRYTNETPSSYEPLPAVHLHATAFYEVYFGEQNHNNSPKKKQKKIWFIQDKTYRHITCNMCLCCLQHISTILATYLRVTCNNFCVIAKSLHIFGKIFPHYLQHISPLLANMNPCYLQYLHLTCIKGPRYLQRISMLLAKHLRITCGMCQQNPL